jgi:hypothetical protein
VCFCQLCVVCTDGHGACVLGTLGAGTARCVPDVARGPPGTAQHTQAALRSSIPDLVSLPLSDLCAEVLWQCWPGKPTCQCISTCQCWPRLVAALAAGPESAPVVFHVCALEVLSRAPVAWCTAAVAACSSSSVPAVATAATAAVFDGFMHRTGLVGWAAGAAPGCSTCCGARGAAATCCALLKAHCSQWSSGYRILIWHSMMCQPGTQQCCGPGHSTL